MKIFRLLAFSTVALFLVTNCSNSKPDPGPDPDPVYHYVTFNTQGGSEIKFQEVEDKKPLSRPTNPEKLGYKFGDWYTDTTFTLRYDFDLPVTSDFTLYAKWNPISYKINYHLNEGTMTDNPQPYTIEDKISIKDATPPTTYQNFGAWYLDEKLTTPIVDKGWNPGDHTGEINLYAKYINPTPYQITYELNGGTNNPQNPSTYTIEDEVVLKDPTFTNNVFVGWYTTSTFDDGSEITKIEKGQVGKIVLYACWHEKSKTLNDTPWPEIKRISKNGVAESCFKIKDKKNILVNNQQHEVRIIGFNEDYRTITKDENDEWVKSDPIGITFEFTNLLSDSNGYSLATYWNNTSQRSTANNNYFDSSIRKALTGKGKGDLHWFEKDGVKYSTAYTYSVLSMLPDDLTKVLSAPSKFISIRSNNIWTEQLVNDELFLLSPREMGVDDDYQEASTTTYSYYKNASDDDRIKHQIKWHENARTESLEVEDGLSTQTRWSYAGFNNSVKDVYGGNSALRSPMLYDKNYGNFAYKVDYDGKIYVWSGGVQLSDNAYAVAPAFCI